MTAFDALFAAQWLLLGALAIVVVRREWIARRAARASAADIRERARIARERPKPRSNEAAS